MKGSHASSLWFAQVLEVFDHVGPDSMCRLWFKVRCQCGR